MSKHEIARWLTPGLTPIRLAFTNFGGSAHGVITLESQDVESGEWSEVKQLGDANGIPEAKGERVSETETVNQFTGERS